MSGVICGRKIAASVKERIYTMVVRPAVMYDLETAELRKTQEAELEMLKFSLGVMRMDKNRNE